MYPDPDDIILAVNEDSQDECAAEINRLINKRRGFRAAFTEIQNIVDRLVVSARGPDNKIDRSEDKLLAIQHYSLQLEQRYEKLQRLNHRILSLNYVEEDEQAYQMAIDVAINLYTQRIDNIGALKIAMLPIKTSKCLVLEVQVYSYDLLSLLSLHFHCHLITL